MKLFEMEKQFTKLDDVERASYLDLLQALPKHLYMSRDKFHQDLMDEAKARGLKPKAPLKKAITKAFGKQDSRSLQG